jgi:hypothetical protein
MDGESAADNPYCDLQGTGFFQVERKLLVYENLSFWCNRPSATGVTGLNDLVCVHEERERERERA